MGLKDDLGLIAIRNTNDGHAGKGRVHFTMGCGLVGQQLEGIHLRILRGCNR